jgi:hypothetical protein
MICSCGYDQGDLWWDDPILVPMIEEICGVIRWDHRCMLALCITLIHTKITVLGLSPREL